MLLVQKRRQRELQQSEVSATEQLEQTGRQAVHYAGDSTKRVSRQMVALAKRKLKDRRQHSRQVKEEIRQREESIRVAGTPISSLPQEQEAPVSSPQRGKHPTATASRLTSERSTRTAFSAPNSGKSSGRHHFHQRGSNAQQQQDSFLREKPDMLTVRGREHTPVKFSANKSSAASFIKEKPPAVAWKATWPTVKGAQVAKPTFVPLGHSPKLAQRQGKKKLIQQAKTAAKSAAIVTRKAAALAVRAATALVSALVGLLGGGVLILLLCGVLLVGALVASPFGIFFSGEDLNGDGRTMQVVMREINQEFSQRLTEIEQANPYDELDRGGTSASWKDVLAIYTVAHSTESENPIEVATITPEKEEFLQQVFWDMNQITYQLEVVAGEEETRILHIRIQGLSRQEAAEKYGFTDRQIAQLAELTDSSLNDAWQNLLYGSFAGSDDLVAVALSQVGNSGESYWSWYGFNSRVEWCAIFVSWCAEQCGYLDAGVFPRFSGCGTGVNWFQARGQWLSGRETPEPGMIIFFKWYGSDASIADHVGIVERVENGRVYTIEGNSGDRVRQNSYPIGYGEILGYGVLISND